VKPATMGIADIQSLDLRHTIPSVLNNSVVVFSTNYLPMARINIRRAITLLISGRAEPLDLQDTKLVWKLRSPSTEIEVPHHIRLKTTTAERLWKLPSVSRRELLRRDGHRCQYCGSAKQLTIDHVIPRSKGGTHTWDNVTIACETCNHKKGDKYLNETAMVLKTKPKAPMHPTVAFAEQFWQSREYSV
jgi:5-methylcytosine-specific restriction endonuclease McrA